MDSKLAGRRLHPEEGMQVASRSFAEGEHIPETFAGMKGSSPEIHFSHPPDGTRELVLLCEDPDAPTSQPFVHWLVYNLPPEIDHLAQDASLPARAREGTNSTGQERYFGPAPPPGHGVHHYHFELFALDTTLNLGGPVDRDRIVEAMRGHVIGFGETVGTFERG
jgi:Raf kinase inhibitor-like YbhB/YbcL family protein